VYSYALFPVVLIGGIPIIYIVRALRGERKKSQKEVKMQHQKNTTKTKWSCTPLGGRKKTPIGTPMRETKHKNKKIMEK
jgi:hypothetical protein